MLFKITEKEGLIYSKISKDKNKIHINSLAGYNSIFGEKICHGTLVISKIFKFREFSSLILSKKLFNIHIKFLDFIKYDENLQIQKLKNKYNVIQNKKIKIVILFNKKNTYLFNGTLKKKNNYIIKRLKSYKSKYDLIFNLLSSISSYVGNKYPGKYSIISSININFNEDFLLNNKNLILSSYKLNRRLPLIRNVLLYKKFNIEFETLERPFVKKNKFFLKKGLKEKIKKFKQNILIIGGSAGIGNDIFNIIKINKKISKIVTFNKNKIKLKSKNTFFYKVDVFKNLKKIEYILKKHGPVKMFYFPTTKIYFDKKVNKKYLKEYKEIFINIPLQILINNKEEIISIFYPSTKNINEDKESDYSIVKRQAEISLKRFCLQNKIIFKSIRFPAINSKQSISLLNPIQQSFFEYINKYPKLFYKIF